MFPLMTSRVELVCSNLANSQRKPPSQRLSSRQPAQMARRNPSSRLIVVLLVVLLSNWPSPVEVNFVGAKHMAQPRMEGLAMSAAKAKAAPVVEAPLEQPKKPANAYIMWLAENRPAIIKKLPKAAQAKVTEITKAAGEAWRALDDKAKAPYFKKTAKAKEVYQKELESFVEAGGVVAPRKSKKSADEKVKKAKDPNKPKRPLTGYVLFGNSVREKVRKSLPDDAKPTEVIQEIAKQWSVLTLDP